MSYRSSFIHVPIGKFYTFTQPAVVMVVTNIRHESFYLSKAINGRGRQYQWFAQLADYVDNLCCRYLNFSLLLYSIFQIKEKYSVHTVDVIVLWLQCESNHDKNVSRSLAVIRSLHFSILSSGPIYSRQEVQFSERTWPRNFHLPDIFQLDLIREREENNKSCQGDGGGFRRNIPADSE